MHRPPQLLPGSGQPPSEDGVLAGCAGGGEGSAGGEDTSTGDGAGSGLGGKGAALGLFATALSTPELQATPVPAIKT